ncbi:hypothetical protein Q5P01_012882 [Channa striata]|uniref:Leucine-rich repeat and IQ domain-containing protein 1 n=1 Tax=Channa striata TaxID=64152 RepID=A0AA88MQB7_CHASR|nr:hypothetical protein Q5P01_012882 [Channa striata]
MSDAKEARDAFTSDSGEGRAGLDASSSGGNTATDDIPTALISYFQTSKSRAVVCEKLILEDFEDFPTSFEDMINLPVEFDEDMMNLNEQINIEPETDVIFPHDVAAGLNIEDNGETDEHVESARHLAFRGAMPKSPVKEEDAKESSKHRAKQHLEEMTKEDQVFQRENDFQKELKKIIEAEKLHQMEIQQMEKRAQERIEHELLLQKELISNLQKQVEEERRMREEELIRIEEEKKKKEKEERRRREEEEDRRKRCDEKIRREMRTMEEEVEKKRIEDARHEAEEERRNNEELRKKKEECKGRGKNDEEGSKEEQKAKAEEAMRKEGEERKLDGSEEEEKKKLMEIKEKEKNKKEEEEETRKREEEEEMGEVSRKTMERDEIRKEKEIPEEQWRNEEGNTRNEEDKKREEETGVWIHQQREEHGNTEEGNRTAVLEIITGEEMTNEVENRKIEDEMQIKLITGKTQTDVERRHSMENKDRIRQENEKFRKRQGEEIKRKQEEEYTKMKVVKPEEGNKTNEAENRKVERERKVQDKTVKEDESINIEADKGQIKREGAEDTEEAGKTEEESRMIIVQGPGEEERLIGAIDLQQKDQENSFISQDVRKTTDSTGHLLTSQLGDGTTWPSSTSGSIHHAQRDSDNSVRKSVDWPDAAEQPRSSFGPLPMCLPERTEQKRLSWMKDCIPWSTLSLQNRRKQKGSARSGRLPRRPAESSRLPPLCPDTLLQSAGLKSLQEVTTVTLEDLPGCNLSTLLHCCRLRSLTLRRCGLKSLEGISQLPELCYVDVEENDISFVDCENMTSLRVLRLAHNRLTSIHGLSGADNLDVLELSHNSISRIAGLESVRRLQRLSVDHNQLISTKGLRDIYTLLHLNCSYNHLASVEGLENSPLLNTLDLRANSLTEPPSLTNHVLLRELRLDDNSISSLQSLTACWLPLMQHLSVAQNRITQLPSMSDFISLEHLDLQFNCMSELQNVCESLEGCHFLQNIHLTGNPLQQESGWRSSLQKALLGLRAIDGQETGYFLPPPAVQQIGLASVSFLSLCRAQIQQIKDLQQRHSSELSKASSPLDAVKSSCQHFAESLKLAEDQRFAHEYGDIIMTAGQTVDMENTNAKTFTEHSPLETTVKAPPVSESRNYIRGSCCIFEEKSSTESWHHMLDTVITAPEANHQSSATKGKTFSSDCKMPALCNHQDQDLALKNTAARAIQQQWRKYRQKRGTVNGLPVPEKQGGRGGDGGNTNSGKSGDPHYAATVIQAFWRGCVVRRRLLSALNAVTCPSTGEDDTFEEIDVDKFVCDEAALEKLWALRLSYDSPSRRDPVSEEPLSLKVPGPFPDRFQYTLPPPPQWKLKHAWEAGEPAHPAGCSSRKSPTTGVLSGISERSEKIVEEWGFADSHTALLMLKRAQRMKSRQQQKNKCMDPSVRLSLFRNCQLGPVEARNRPASHHRNFLKVSKTTLGHEQCDKKERVQQWLHAQSDRDSESEHFLPEISPDILKGGRVQLVADPAYTERHHASGLWANSSPAAQPRNTLNHYAHRKSLGHTRKQVPSPKRVTSAPSKKERISFRDNPVQQSYGWGGGKKRDKVNK